MPTPPSKTVVTGRVYKTKRNGDLIVTDYINNTKVKVRFVKTGYERFATVQSIVNGSVKDPFCRNIFGVGCIGIGVHSRKSNTKGYDVWFRMIERCYSKEAQKKPKNSSYAGVSVCDEWLNFQVFSEWYLSNYIKGYELDKDKLQFGSSKKVYSADTCVFISKQENNEISHARNYILVSPVGEKVDIYNMAKFCEGKDLNASAMYSVFLGKRKSYKGWVRHENR